ncbi:MAG: ACP synthase, partial [Acidimicrobiia bacterium]
MTSPVRILSVGAAAPTLRLPAAEVAAAWGRSRGARGQAGVCAPDEDVLTLAADAAGRALAASGLQHDIVDGLWWGTTRPPFAEGPSHAVLAAALGLSSHSAGALCSGSPHAGMEALIGAADAVAAGSARVALVVAADVVVPGPGT